MRIHCSLQLYQSLSIPSLPTLAFGGHVGALVVRGKRGAFAGAAVGAFHTAALTIVALTPDENGHEPLVTESVPCRLHKKTTEDQHISYHPYVLLASLSQGRACHEMDSSPSA